MEYFFSRELIVNVINIEMENYMKELTAFMALLISTSAFANFGQIVDCPSALMEHKTENSSCRDNEEQVTSLYNANEGLLYSYNGAEVSISQIDGSQLKLILERYEDYNDILDLAINHKLNKLIVFKHSATNSNNQYIYLLDKNLDKNQIVVSILYQGNDLELSSVTTFNNSHAIIQKPNGTILNIDIATPSLAQVSKEAFNNYEIPSTGWTFLQQGLGSYPTYEKVKDIFDQCDDLKNKGRKKRCFKRMEKKLQKDMLLYIQENMSSNRDLRDYLGEDQRLEYNVTSSLFQAYRKLTEAPILNPNYAWELEYYPISNQISLYGIRPALQYTFDISRDERFFSLGNIALKYGRVSTRHGYYPLGAID